MLQVCAGRPLLAEDCLPPAFDEGLLLRKQTLELDESAAITDPTETFDANEMLYVFL